MFDSVPLRRAPVCARRMLASLSLAVVFAAPAHAAGTATYVVTVNGTTVLNETTSVSAVTGLSGNGYSALLSGVGSAGFAQASAFMTGTVNGQAKVDFVSDDYQYSLKRPAAGANLANGRFVMYFRLEGNLTPGATIDSAATVDVSTVTGPGGSATVTRSLANQPGDDSAEFNVSVDLPGDFPSQGSIRVTPILTLKAVATIGGGVESANAKAKRFKAVGFRVYDASGKQLTGFALSGSSAIPELVPEAPGLARAVEFYNAAFGHYFISANPAEIANLDSGKTPGWVPTGESFNVYATNASGLAGVCRFLGIFPPKSSHFYAPQGLGCEALLPSDPVWQYEGIVFYTALPDANGGCPAGSVPVYRLYNNGRGGAPNHRFTINQSTQVDMIEAGYVAEGNGAGVGMCSPQ